jgi:hypothetical protein
VGDVTSRPGEEHKSYVHGKKIIKKMSELKRLVDKLSCAILRKQYILETGSVLV